MSLMCMARGYHHFPSPKSTPRILFVTQTSPPKTKTVYAIGYLVLPGFKGFGARGERGNQKSVLLLIKGVQNGIHAILKKPLRHPNPLRPLHAHPP